MAVPRFLQRYPASVGGSSGTCKAALLRATGGAARSAFARKSNAGRGIAATSAYEDVAAGTPTSTLSAAADNSADESERVENQSLGFGFSAGGMLFPYLIGVMSGFREKEIMTGVAAACPREWAGMEVSRPASDLAVAAWKTTKCTLQ